MKHLGLRRRTSLASCAGLVLAASLAGVAYAALPLQGNGTTGVGGGVAYQAMSWNHSSRTVNVTSRTANGMSLDRCIDAIFDWRTSNGQHYDGRKARNCQPGSATTGVKNEPSGWSGRTINAVRIVGGCYYNQAQSPPTYFGCDSVAGSDGPYPQPVAWNSLSHFVILRDQNGQEFVNQGGVPSQFNG